MSEYSVNDRAEKVMGRRVADGESVVAIDLPVELGYQCPIHKRDIMDTDLYGPPVLQWSEWPWPCSTERLHRLAEGSTDA